MPGGQASRVARTPSPSPIPASPSAFSPEGPTATPPAPDVQDLRAQVVSLSEANRLLIAAQQELLDADRATNDAAEKYRAVARSYLDALAQFMTPGHLGDMADL